MKLKDHFLKQKNQAKIENEEFNAFIEALPDIEFPDLARNLIEDNFITRERAMADPKIVNKIKAETLNGVDTNIQSILPGLSAAKREAIEKETNTYKKVELLKEAFETSMAEAKASNPDASEEVKSVKKVNQDLLDKIKAINSERETEKAGLISTFEKEKTGMKLDWTLDKKFADYEFGDEYKPLKGTIIKSIIDGIKSNHVLETDSNGGIVVLEVDNETKTTKPKFNGNTQVTIDDLLVDPLKPFLKKSNGGGTGQEGQGQQRRVPSQQAAPPKAANEMTLRELRAAGQRTMQ